MNNDYVAEILRATGSLRSGDPAGVTAIIQSALAAAGLASSVGNAASGDPHSSFQLPRTLPLGMGHEAEAFPPQSDRLRKPLNEVIRTLRAGGMGLGLEGLMPGQPAHIPALPLPDGAEFLDLRYSCAAGARRYRLYVPSSAGEGLQGLIVMLHGCTQNPEDFAAGTGMNVLAEEHRLLVVYPAQTGGDNSMSCWNWFRPGDQLRGSGEPAIIAGLTESLRDQYAIPEDRIFVAGLSAGGAMAAIMGETYPELFAATGVHSGLAYGSANDVMSAFTAMRGQVGIEQRSSRCGGAGSETAPRMIVFHGSADTTVHPSNAERIMASQGGSPGKITRSEHGPSGDIRAYTRLIAERDDGTNGLESWMIDGAQHAWSGGHPSGSYTDPRGPDASAAMVRFFLHGASDRAAG
jgi:poly(hydroxyalkanoate) depolymerase family esterase